MKTIEKLIDAATMSGERKTIGNHSFIKSYSPLIVRFAYHGNVVCYWNRETNSFRLDDCGWKGYTSTTRTLNDYRRILVNELGAHEEI